MLKTSITPTSTSDSVTPENQSRPKKFSWDRCYSISMIAVLIGTGFVLIALFITSPQSGPKPVDSTLLITGSNSQSDEFDLEKTSVPVSDILRGGPPKDGIPAILKPQFITAANADFLNPEDVVIGVAISSSARAYPLRILNYHEIVNDSVSDIPIAVTYCPLCDSACVFDCRTPLGDREFGVSGLLYNSNVLMYDRGGKPESLWSQLKVKGISGPGLDQTLKTLPVEMTTWLDWKTRHPATDVLSLNTGHQRDYATSPYQSYFMSPDLMFRVDHRDARLPVKTRVLGIWSENKQVAVPETMFAVNDSNAEISSALDGLNFTVSYSRESNTMRVVSADSGLQWMYSFWFAWAAFYPETSIQTLP